MLCVATVTEPMGRTYYANASENYYTRDASVLDRWQGNLCKEGGLQEGSAIQADQFQLMLANAGSEKCSAYDCTFSAPKSVSILAELGTDAQHKNLLAAHQAAVEATLHEIEDKEIGARITHDGITEHVHTGQMIAAKFEHDISREMDPQMHTHCVIMNRTEYQGKSYAVDGSPLYKIQKVYGMEYRARLAAELQARGYAIHVTDPEHGFFELDGIEAETLQHFSKRRQQIEQALHEQGVSGAKAAQQATLETRKAKEHTDIQELRKEWRQELAHLQELPREQGQGASRQMTEEDRKAIYMETVKAMELQQFAWTPMELEGKVMAHGVPFGMTREDARRLIQQDPRLLEAHLKGRDVGLVYLTTQANLDREQKIFQAIEAGKGRAKAMTYEQAQTALRRICKEHGWHLRPQQAEMVQHIATSNDRFLGVVGLAGTGKSFSLNAAREVLEQAGYEVRGMSASGQAAQELAADAGLEGQNADGTDKCATIHRQLNQAEKLAGNAKQEDYLTKTEWDFSNLPSSDHPVVWFMDEASLTDNNTLSYVVDMIERRGDKLVMIGDPSQLQPVGCGAAFTEAIHQSRLSYVRLDEIQRQKDEQLLQAVREAVLGKVQKSLDLVAKDTVAIKSYKKRMQALTKDYVTLSPKEQRQTIVLTANNKDRVLLNEQIRNALIEKGELQHGVTYQVEAQKGQPTVSRELSVGDKIVFLQNDMRMGVMNGTKGIIQSLDGDRITVNVGKERPITFDISKYRWLDHAYALTTYKAQGMTVTQALIHMDSKDKLLNSRNGYYVNLSRARMEAKLYIDDRQKVESQISDFAQKITSKDLTWDQESGRFQRNKRRSRMVERADRSMRKPRQSAHFMARGVEAAGRLIQMVPVMGRPMKLALEAPVRAVTAIGRETSTLAMDMLRKAERVVSMEVDIGQMLKRERNHEGENAIRQRGNEKEREDEAELE